MQTLVHVAHCIRTVGTPQDIKQVKPKKDDYPVMEEVRRCQFICWMDHNTATLATTVHTTATFNKQTRSRQLPTGFMERQKLCAIEMYTNYMRGVDLADQAMWYSLDFKRNLNFSLRQ